jgi:zinc and cadmium transporter
MVGGILAYFGLGLIRDELPFILAVAASSFIYIAVADLIPSLHQKTTLRAALQQVALILAGVWVIYLVHGHQDAIPVAEDPIAQESSRIGGF